MGEGKGVITIIDWEFTTAPGVTDETI